MEKVKINHNTRSVVTDLDLFNEKIVNLINKRIKFLMSTKISDEEKLFFRNQLGLISGEIRKETESLKENIHSTLDRININFYDLFCESITSINKENRPIKRVTTGSNITNYYSNEIKYYITN